VSSKNRAIVAALEESGSDAEEGGNNTKQILEFLRNKTAKRLPSLAASRRLIWFCTRKNRKSEPPGHADGSDSFG